VYCAVVLDAYAEAEAGRAAVLDRVVADEIDSGGSGGEAHARVGQPLPRDAYPRGRISEVRPAL
jgi:hypothetical protein